jgi:hypothetical protein
MTDETQRPFVVAVDEAAPFLSKPRSGKTNAAVIVALQDLLLLGRKSGVAVRISPPNLVRVQYPTVEELTFRADRNA